MFYLCNILTSILKTQRESHMMNPNSLQFVFPLAEVNIVYRTCHTGNSENVNLQFFSASYKMTSLPKTKMT